MVTKKGKSANMIIATVLVLLVGSTIAWASEIFEDIYIYGNLRVRETTTQGGAITVVNGPGRDIVSIGDWSSHPRGDSGGIVLTTTDGDRTVVLTSAGTSFISGGDVTFGGGKVKISRLSANSNKTENPRAPGPGDGYVCVDVAGVLFRSQTACK